jgi:hypothetical protein
VEIKIKKALLGFIKEEITKSQNLIEDEEK